MKKHDDSNKNNIVNVLDNGIPVYDFDRVLYDSVIKVQKELAEEDYTKTEALIKATDLYYNVFLVEVFPYLILNLIKTHAYSLATDGKEYVIIRGGIEFLRGSTKSHGGYSFVPEYNKIVYRVPESIDDESFKQFKILINNMLCRNGIGSFSGFVNISGRFDQLNQAYKNELNYITYYLENVKAVEEDFPRTLK